MFINEYKQFNILKNYQKFLKKIKGIQLYIIEFEENNIMKN